MLLISRGKIIIAPTGAYFMFLSMLSLLLREGERVRGMQIEPIIPCDRTSKDASYNFLLIPDNNFDIRDELEALIHTALLGHLSWQH